MTDDDTAHAPAPFDQTIPCPRCGTPLRYATLVFWGARKRIVRLAVVTEGLQPLWVSRQDPSRGDEPSRTPCGCEWTTAETEELEERAHQEAMDALTVLAQTTRRQLEAARESARLRRRPKQLALTLPTSTTTTKEHTTR